MKITKVETIQHPSYPVLTWVKLHTDAGLVGLGETIQGAPAVAGMIHGTFADILLGRDPSEIELLWHHMYRYAHYGGYAGTEMRAISAIDIALWDLLGKVHDVPVYKLLGGACREKIPTYNTCGSGGDFPDHERFHDDPAGLAQDLLDNGIQAMKIWPFDDVAAPSNGQKISRDQLEYGVSRIRAIRDAVGDEMEIALEGHCLWNLPSAIKIARAVEPFNLMFLEELMFHDDPDATRQLREATSTPLVTSERLISLSAFKKVLDRGAADIAMIDICWTGGLSEAKKIAALAESYQLPMAPHNPGGPVNHLVVTHYCASIYNFFIMESVRGYYCSWFPEVVTYTHLPVQGEFPLPPGPGLGTELSETFLSQNEIVRQETTARTGRSDGYIYGNPYRSGTNLWRPESS